MFKFPKGIINSSKSYAEKYFETLIKVSKKIDIEKIKRISELLAKYYNSNHNVFVCGNGGSAAISNHFLCDHLKGVSTNTKLLPRVISLSANIELITAVANDIKYEDIFAFQLSRLSKPKDCLITISSSGNSQNIINAIKWAKKNKIKTVSLSGFNGGEAKKISDLDINIPCNNYGIIEDLHQSIMHVLAQNIRMDNMRKKDISKINF